MFIQKITGFFIGYLLYTSLVHFIMIKVVIYKQTTFRIHQAISLCFRLDWWLLWGSHNTLWICENATELGQGTGVDSLQSRRRMWLWIIKGVFKKAFSCLKNKYFSCSKYWPRQVSVLAQLYCNNNNCDSYSQQHNAILFPEQQTPRNHLEML